MDDTEQKPTNDACLTELVDAESRPSEGERTLEKRGMMPTNTRFDGGRLYVDTTNNKNKTTEDPYTEGGD